jgi:predicted nucleotidyltransferase
MIPGLSTTQVKSIVAALAGYDGVAVYRFGSRVTENQRPDSDIAFLPRRSVAALDCFHLGNRLACELGSEVDLVDLSSASTVMAKEVITKGFAISIRDSYAQQTFEMPTLSDYARLNEERREILAS